MSVDQRISTVNQLIHHIRQSYTVNKSKAQASDKTM